MGHHHHAYILHRKAVSLWPNDVPWDPRSELFRAAGDRLIREMDTSDRPESRRVANWLDAIGRHEDFWRQHRHRPREKTRNQATLPDHERRLGEWARYQRRFQDRLCQYQLLRLDVSPSFAWDPQTEDWQANLDACARLVRATGQLPRLTSTAPHEFALARWLGRQLEQLHDGTLQPSRRQHLETLLNGHNHM